MGVITNKKRFRQEDLQENESKAIVTSLILLKELGYKLEKPLEEQPEAYKDWDFIVSYKGEDVPVEVERKRVWWGSTFPYRTVDVPYRKKHTKSKLFIMFNKECDTAAITKTSNILSSEVITKNTTYTSNERFFSVPLDKWKFYDMSQK